MYSQKILTLIIIVIIIVIDHLLTVDKIFFTELRTKDNESQPKMKKNHIFV